MSHKTTCTKCEALAESEGLAIEWHYTLCDDIHATHWGGEIPEIEVLSSQCLGEYCGERCATEAADSYLTLLGAVRGDCDIGPVESCSACGADIDTRKPHRVTHLTFERFRPEKQCVEVADSWYLARFCNSCIPVGSEASTNSEVSA